MAFRHQSLQRRMLGPVIAAIALGSLVGGLGAYAWGSRTPEPQPQVATDRAIFGDSDYGERSS